MTAITWRTPTTARSAYSTSSATRGATPVSLQIDAELAAVARFARGVHAAGHRAQLGDGLDQARQQAGIGGSGDEEEGSDGASLRARRSNAGGDSLGWHGRIVLTRDRGNNRQRPAPSGNRDNNNSLGDQGVKDGLHGGALYAHPR